MIIEKPVQQVGYLPGLVRTLATGIHRPSILFSVVLLIALTVVIACVLRTAPAARFPIVSGFHDSLPPPTAKIVVWGNRRVADTAAEWLARHHFIPIRAADIVPLRGAASHLDRSLVLSYARSIPADFVIFLDAEVRSGGAIEEPVCRRGHHIDVTAQGVSVASGDIQWSGSAHYTRCIAVSVETWRGLTCQALAAAWGLRPSGQLEIPSQLMCTSGQTEKTLDP